MKWIRNRVARWRANDLVRAARRAQTAYMLQHPNNRCPQALRDLQTIEGICKATAKTVVVHT